MVHTHQVQASHVVDSLTDIHLRNPVHVYQVTRDRVTTTPTLCCVRLTPDGHLLTTHDLITATVSATVLSYPCYTTTSTFHNISQYYQWVLPLILCYKRPGGFWL